MNFTKESCRVCMEEGTMISIFQERRTFRISTKIESLSGVKIDPGDGLPNTICRKCVKTLENCVKFIHKCQESDLKYKSLIKTEDSYDNLECSEDSMNLQIDESNTETVNGDEYLDVGIEATIQEDVGKVSKSKRKAKKQQCFTCGKVMSSRFRLKTHMRIHTGERPYSCQHCSKTFALAQNLKVHLRIHTGEKPLVCVECGASFAHSAGLAAHRRKHSGAAPYACALCPRRFRTGGHLQYHIRRHTGEKKFECNTCNRAFITRSDLKQHLLTHSGDKPHVCCICGLRLTRASHLKRHIQFIHNGDKSLTCNLCSSKFTRKSDFEKHKLQCCEAKTEKC